MELMTIISAGLIFVLLIVSILIPGGDLFLYLDLASFVIVILGGTFSVMVSYPPEIFLKVGKFLKVGFSKPQFDFKELVNTLIALGDGARRDGLLSLEDKLEGLDNQFLKKGIQMAVDGMDEETIRSALDIDMDQLDSRHGIGKDVIDSFGALLPAFGMIGTLIGLIMMLANLEDKSKVGSGMAAALITTLYGAVFANGIFIPLGKKLEVLHNKETLFQNIVVEGILSIVRGDNSQLIRDKLISFLSDVDRKALEAQEESK